MMADMEILDKITRYLNQVLIVLGGMLLIAMIFLTCSNIFLRLVWTPIDGTFELMGFFGAIITAFALGYTQMKKGHIAIDIVVNQFSAKTVRLLEAINHLTCMVFFGIVSWRLFVWAGTLCRTGEITETLRIIFYPFTYGVALGCLVLTLVLLIDLLKLLVKKEES